jgi:hypothetical protein
VETYTTNKPYENGDTKLTVQFPGVSVPSESTIYQMVNKYGRMGSFFNQMQQKT